MWTFSNVKGQRTTLVHFTRTSKFTDKIIKQIQIKLSLNQGWILKSKICLKLLEFTIFLDQKGGKGMLPNSDKSTLNRALAFRVSQRHPVYCPGTSSWYADY